MGDGYIFNKGLRIRLSVDDKDHLDKFFKIIKKFKRHTIEWFIVENRSKKLEV